MVMVKGLSRFLNQEVKIIFDDGHIVSTRQGKLISVTKDFLVIFFEGGEAAIPRERLVRIEAVSNAKKK